MRVIVAGLETKAGLAYIGDAFPLQYDVQWYGADEFLDKAQSEADEEDVKWVWLYCPPWMLPQHASTKKTAVEALGQWQRRQRRILQLRRYLRNRVVLVNTDKVDAYALAQHLGMDASKPSCDSGPVSGSHMAAILEKVFKEVASDYRALYDSLESAAWLPQEKREHQSSAVPSAEGLEQLLGILYAGQQASQSLQQVQAREQRTMYQLREANDLVQRLTEKLDATRNMAGRSEHRCKRLNQKIDILEKRLANKELRANAAREESETLLAQLHQVQEQFEKQRMDSVVMTDEHAKLKEHLEQSLRTEQTLTQERNAARQIAVQYEEVNERQLKQLMSMQNELNDTRAAVQASEKDRDLLLAQLHQTQEELENHNLTNNQIMAVMEQSKTTMDQARKFLIRLAHG